jgi:hypothetical protein
MTATMPPLLLGQLVREWEFSELRGDALKEVVLDHGIQVGGLVHQLYDFGPAFHDADVNFPDGTSLPSDGIATGQIASTGDGVTYWVGAEAPAGLAALPEAPIGGRSGAAPDPVVRQAGPRRVVVVHLERGVHRSDRPQRRPVSPVPAGARRRVVLRPGQR